MTKVEALNIKMKDLIFVGNERQVVTRIQVSDRDIKINGKSYKKIKLCKSKE